MSQATGKLLELTQERDAELRNLRRLYARARRDFRHSVSPDRFIRRHMAASLLGAAVVGMLIAPAPRYQRSGGAPGGPPGKSGGGWRRTLSLVLKLLTGSRRPPGQTAGLDGTMSADGPEAEATEAHGRRDNTDGRLHAVLREVAEHLDWPALLRAFVDGIRAGRHNDGGSGNADVPASSAEPTNADGDFVI